MDIKTMKIDLFVIKAIESKGYTLDELVKMTDDELHELKLPHKIIENIVDYKHRGIPLEGELKENINVIKDKNDVPVNVDDITAQYKSVEVEPEPEQEKVEIIVEDKPETTPDVSDTENPMVNDNATIIDDITDSEKQKETVTDTEQKLDETVKIVHKTVDGKLLEEVRSILNSKELKTTASYVKLLRTEMGADKLKQIDGSTLSGIIDERIAQIKSK